MVQSNFELLSLEHSDVLEEELIDSVVVKNVSLYDSDNWTTEMSKVFLKKMYAKLYTEDEQKPEENTMYVRLAKYHILGVLFGADVKNLLDMLSMSRTKKSISEEENLQNVQADYEMIDDILVEFRDILKLQLQNVLISNLKFELFVESRNEKDFFKISLEKLRNCTKLKRMLQIQSFDMIYLRVVEILILWIANLDSITFDFGKFGQIIAVFDKVSQEFTPDEEVEELLASMTDKKQMLLTHNIYKIIDLIECWIPYLQLDIYQIKHLAEHLIETLEDPDLYNHAHMRLNSIVSQVVYNNWSALIKSDNFLMCRFSNFIISYMKLSLPKKLDFSTLLKSETLLQFDNNRVNEVLEHRITVKENEVLAVFNDNFGIGRGIIDGTIEDLEREKREKQEAKLELQRKKEKAKNQKKRLAKEMEKEEVAERPHARLTRKMKKVFRAEVKRVKELKITVDEQEDELISDSDSSILSEEEEEEAVDPELQKINTALIEKRPLNELDATQSRIEDAEGFMRVLSDKLFMHLDSVWRQKDYEKTDVLAKEEITDLWTESISCLYGAVAWGKSNDASSSSAVNMVANVAWWRLFCEFWSKIPLSADKNTTKVLDILLTNLINSSNVSRFVNHVGVFFLQHILIENGETTFVKEKYGMEKIFNQLAETASTGETFQFFDTNKSNKYPGYMAFYLNMYNIMGIQRATSSGQINNQIFEIYKNKGFLDKKNYSNQHVDHIIRHGMGILLSLEKKKWIYGEHLNPGYRKSYRQGISDYYNLKAKKNYLDLYGGDSNTYIRKLQHIDIEKDVKELRNMLCGAATPLMANGLSHETSKVIASLKFLEDNGFTRSKDSSEEKLVAMYQCKVCGEITFKQGSLSSDNNSFCVGCGIPIGKEHERNVNFVGMVSRKEVEAMITVLGLNTQAFPYQLHKGYDAEVMTRVLEAPNTYTMYIGRIFTHLMMLTNYYLGLDMINENLDKTQVIDTTHSTHEEKARAIRLDKLREIIKKNNKKDLDSQKTLDIFGLRNFLIGTGMTQQKIDTNKYLTKAIRNDLVQLKKLLKVDFRSLAIYMDFFFYFFYDSVESALSDSKVQLNSFDNTFYLINDAIQRVIKNKQALYQQYLKAISSDQNKDKLKNVAFSMWCSNSMGPGEYRNMLGFSDTDMEVKRLLRHTGKIDFNEIRQKIAYMEDCEILMNYFMRSMVLSIVRPILTVYIELLKQVKELCNGRFSAKELSDLTLGQVLQDKDSQSEHKNLCVSIESLFAQFAKLWLQKIEPLVERMDNNKLVFRFQCEDLPDSKIKQFTESLSDIDSAPLLYFALVRSRDTVTENSQLTLKLNDTSMIPKAILSTICTVQNSFIEFAINEKKIYQQRRTLDYNDPVISKNARIFDNLKVKVPIMKMKKK